jgi:glycosyltransferase involved in cell wall biosynthesis
MYIFKTPNWIHKYEFHYDSYNQIPEEVFESININLSKTNQTNPLVSIVITAWNEEVTILKTIASIATQKTQYQYEIIVVDNNSTDNTSLTLEKLNIQKFFQPIQGWGPGRQMGMENAKGKYILLADSDCIYPDCWVETMTRNLEKKGIVCVYGRYSFIDEKDYPRYKLFILESLKNVISELRHFKRPFLNCYGMSMGFIKELGLKEGFYMNYTRGEDGRMCYDLMKYGRVKQIRSNKNRIWTGVRTIKKNGSFIKAISQRIFTEIKRMGIYFNLKFNEPHPTKESDSNINK